MWGCGGPGSGTDLLQIYLQFENHVTSQFGCNNLKSVAKTELEGAPPKGLSAWDARAVQNRMPSGCTKRSVNSPLARLADGSR